MWWLCKKLLDEIKRHCPQNDSHTQISAECKGEEKKEKYPPILASKASCLCRFSLWRTCTLVLAMEEMVDITGATCRTWVSIKVPYSFCFQLITGAALHNSVTSSFPFISFDSICKRYSGYFPIFCILMWRCIVSNRQRHCSHLNVIPVFMWEILFHV